jgi:hypothetical protein
MIFFDIICSKQVPKLKMLICSGTQLTTNVKVTTGLKYNWVVPLGTTSRNGQRTKLGQIIFMGLFLKMFS